ncbi:MAG: ATP-grasp domain-containing protein [Saprospiraceae bacterium]|nr:ATP-grasp domain-containing protein [Saprospiraceae bacterium]
MHSIYFLTINPIRFTRRRKFDGNTEGVFFPELLVSEVLTGEEFTVDTIVNKGKPILILPRLRSKMNGGISIEGQFIENQEIIQYAHQILSSLSLHGAIGLQVKRAADGRFKILEINPRIQGTSVAALGIGINLPLLPSNKN